MIAPKAYMKIETRGENDELADYIYKRAVQVLEGAAQMHRAQLKIIKRGEANSATSSPELTALVSQVAETVSGVRETTCLDAQRGSDDACWFMKNVCERDGQATYIGIGATTTSGHHNDHFDFDETAMER